MYCALSAEYSLFLPLLPWDVRPYIEDLLVCLLEEGDKAVLFRIYHLWCFKQTGGNPLPTFT